MKTTDQIAAELIEGLGGLQDDVWHINLSITDIRALLEERKAMKEALEWQPMETAPRDGTEILGFWGYLYEGDTAPTEGVDIIEYDGAGNPKYPWTTGTERCLEDSYTKWKRIHPPAKSALNKGGE